ncbi:MAG: SpoIIE family protein phosphatase [Chloroflexota bacterium]
MHPEQTLVTPARYANLAAISEFAAAAAKTAGLDEAAIYSIQMAVDEACSNIIEHAYGGEDRGEIGCTCIDSESNFTIVLSDHGQAFDPNRIALPDIQASIEDRPIGGLGLFFIRQLMDDVRFEFKPAKDAQPPTNLLTLVKRKSTSSNNTYEAIRHRADRLALVAEVSHAIISILDLKKLLDTVVHLLARRLDYPYVQVFTVHPGRRKVFYESGSLPGNEELKREHFSYDLDDTQGIIPWVARSGIAVLANDVIDDPRYRLSEGMPARAVRSELTIPLIFGGEVHGVLDVQSDQPKAFGEEDRSLLEALGGNIAIALRNATLYHAEAWRRQVADGMREVAGLLSADADLVQVLDAILVELERNLPCEAAAIWLLTDQQDAQAALELAAFHPVQADPGPELSLPPGPWLESVLLALEPITRTNDSPFEPLGQLLAFPEDYSAIAAPLRVGERCLGTLVLAHSTPNRYGSEARSITATFASYAAVAIENTRLYEASHEQAWVATVLLQVAEAAQAVEDIDELLAQVARIATLLTGVNVCVFWLWDGHSEVFVPSAAHGIEPEVLAGFFTTTVDPGEHPVFEQVRVEQKATVMEYGGLETFKSTSGAANILFPLVAHSGDALGVLLAGFASVEAALREDNLAIIQGIAHQTATAIENIRLLRSQREEAYVSVALLQVAQAIVSLNELDEILDTITRIIPILAGVRRSGIFLYDEQHQAFSLTESYGFAGELNDARFVCHSSAFPLLETAWRTGQLVYTPIRDGVGVYEWASLPPAVAQYDPTVETETIYAREMLRSEDRLLFAFPLAVKGHVLGVMVAEEAEARTGGTIAAIRTRRLEILTGICQQLSLAIQNDRLQHEVLERERLERELQLARQIQQTFLPEELPHLDGWELSVRWRTARQVGGDFYDVFELPDQRIGLVIADVADKGMPAALFMTLVRTLIRAAVRENPSPAAVLQRVNDLLIPDTRNGMFVTVVYAVLSIENGELLYANAGHNPPLLLQRASGEVQRLITGGMALGIVENVRIPEEKTVLNRGDFLVFYTDGITEAFSPRDEMYGEERLHLVLRTSRESGVQHTQDILDTIDQSVDRFIEDEVPSDDVTMIALMRE